MTSQRHCLVSVELFGAILGLMRFYFGLCFFLSCATPAVTDAPPDAAHLDAGQALACIATRYLGEPLRIEEDDDGLILEIRWLTPAGNVLEFEMTGPGCRFLEVEGVGQTEARILPEPAR